MWPVQYSDALDFVLSARPVQYSFCMASAVLGCSGRRLAWPVQYSDALGFVLHGQCSTRMLWTSSCVARAILGVFGPLEIDKHSKRGQDIFAEGLQQKRIKPLQKDQKKEQTVRNGTEHLRRWGRPTEGPSCSSRVHAIEYKTNDSKGVIEHAQEKVQAVRV